jgi:ribonuclease VapC
VSSVVLDASAILAVVHRERGFEKVVPHLDGGLISAVNYAEVLKKAVERGTELLTARQLLQNFAIVVVPFDILHAAETARLWPLCRSLGLSFADRACLSLGILRSLPILTADAKIAEVPVSVRVKMIR